jgi:hypothetical protein
MKNKQSKIIRLPKILDKRGNLSFIQNCDQIPFVIKRVYWIYGVPGGEVRGGHAYKKLEEIIIALSGSFDVEIDDGAGKLQIYNLNRSYKGLYVPGMTWRQLRHFSTNAVVLILASRSYEANDYIYDYINFKQAAND